jgi:hypothetical protein
MTPGAWRDTAGFGVAHLFAAQPTHRWYGARIAFYDVESSRSLAISFRHLVI